MNISAYEEADATKVDEATKLFSDLTKENIDSALRILCGVIKNTQDNYVFRFVQGNTLYVKFWSKLEFLHFSTFKDYSKQFNEIIWIRSAYPKAYYYLGILLSRMREFVLALKSYKKGLIMEPSNPRFLIGIGNVYSAMNKHSKALEYYQQIGDVNPYISPRLKALALRSEGVQSIELGNLIYARKVFLRSLELEPNNNNAINELMYINDIEKGLNSSYKVSIQNQMSITINKCMYCSREFEEGELRKVNNDIYFVCNNCLTKRKSKE